MSTIFISESTVTAVTHPVIQVCRGKLCTLLKVAHLLRMISNSVTINTLLGVFQDYLNDVANDPVKSKICKTRVLCRTLAGNLVYVLTISSPTKTAEEAKVG